MGEFVAVRSSAAARVRAALACLGSLLGCRLRPGLRVLDGGLAAGELVKVDLQSKFHCRACRCFPSVERTTLAPMAAG